MTFDKGSAVLAAAALGCADIASSDVRTSGMYADIAAIADGTGGSQARVVLKAGGATSTTYVELTGTDRLVASLDGAETPMIHEELGVIHSYVATFADAPVGVPYGIAFERATDESAPDSSVTLPPEVTLAPLPDSFSRLDDDLTISWSPPSDELVRLEVNGTCIEYYRTELSSDGGSFEIPRGTLAPARTTQTPEPCDLDVTVTRILAGSVDAAFGEGGSAEGRQVRSAHVSSTP